VKRCSTCKMEKPLDSFRNNSSAKDGKSYQCMECRKAYNQRESTKALQKGYTAKYRLAHPDVVKTSQDKYNAANAEWKNAYYLEYQKANPQTFFAATQRRRAKKLDNGSIPYNRWQVFNDDNRTCQICGSSINPVLQKPDPMSFCIDHIWPLKMGGPDCRENVRSVHLECNGRRPKNGYDISIDEFIILFVRIARAFRKVREA
jgi:hypothetical protein